MQYAKSTLLKGAAIKAGSAVCPDPFAVPGKSMIHSNLGLGHSSPLVKNPMHRGSTGYGRTKSPVDLRTTVIRDEGLSSDSDDSDIFESPVFGLPRSPPIPLTPQEHDLLPQPPNDSDCFIFSEETSQEEEAKMQDLEAWNEHLIYVDLLSEASVTENGDQGDHDESTRLAPSVQEVPLSLKLADKISVDSFMGASSLSLGPGSGILPYLGSTLNSTAATVANTLGYYSEATNKMFYSVEADIISAAISAVLSNLCEKTE